MPKYLFQGSYSQQGLQGVLQEGGSKRREAAEQLIKGMGGRLESRVARRVRLRGPKLLFTAAHMILWFAFYDDAGNVIETHEHVGEFTEP